MSVNLYINDYDDYSHIDDNVCDGVSGEEGVDLSNNAPLPSPKTLFARETRIDISSNIMKQPLDILKEELKLKIDTINPLELLDYDYEEHISSTGDQYSRISYTGVEKSLEALYSNANETSSSAMDILATYVRGQKLIYMEA